MTRKKEHQKPTPPAGPEGIPPLPEAVPFPGLTPGSAEIPALFRDLPKRVAALRYKERAPCLWVVIVGGTGTGKSTVFNALCGRPLSDAGAERPKTRGPIAYAHRDCFLGEPFPMGAVEKADVGRPVSGAPGKLVVVEHDRPDWSRLVLLDTPDLDSVAAENRKITEDLHLLSDAVVFVTSQEKYADEVPYQFLRSVIPEIHFHYFLLNKSDGLLTIPEVTSFLDDAGIPSRGDRLWLIPRMHSADLNRVRTHQGFENFVARLSRDLLDRPTHEVLARHRSRSAGELEHRLVRLLGLLEAEERAAGEWLSRLDQIYERRSRELVRAEQEQFAARSREYLGREIRRLFSRYDVLAGPRRAVQKVLLSPFRLLRRGRDPASETPQERLAKIREKIDLTPLHSAVEQFHVAVLEDLSPGLPSAPLFQAIRDPSVPLSEGDVRDHIWKEQEQLASWLETRFHQLTRDIPKGKKLGIYSTSVIWGALIILFETILGGGFTIIDAALDSVLAPLVTKGATELFAFQEIRSIARELSRRYEKGLLSVLGLQRDRYERSLKSLLPSGETMDALRALQAQAAKWKQTGRIPESQDPLI